MSWFNESRLSFIKLKAKTNLAGDHSWGPICFTVIHVAFLNYKYKNIRFIFKCQIQICFINN